MKSDLTSCRRYLMSRPPYLWDANLVTQRAGVERKVIKLRKDRDRDRLQYLSLFLFKIFLHTTKRQIALCLKNVYSIYDARLFCRGILC